MDKIFTPNRFFVGFCGLLVVAVISWNIARDQLILEEAKEIGRQEAEWSWPAMGISTNVDEIQAKILKRTDNDAQVEVHGKQKIIMQAPDADAAGQTQPPAGQESSSKAVSQSSSGSAAGAKSGSNSGSVSESSSDFKAVLTLYKQGNSRVWLLGKVEGE